MFTLYKKITLIALLALCVSINAQETLTKKIEKTFKLTNTGELHLDNKYGNVTIKGWEENKATLTIDIKVTNKKKDNAKTLLDRIEANIRTASNFVSVESEISEKNTSFFSRYFNKVNPFEFDKGNVEINYTIYLPINAEIDVTNKFGDVIIDNWIGKLKANIEHGDLWINDNVTNANIDMKFGKLRSKSITYGSINLKNGDIDIENSKDLLLTTSGVNIELGSVTDLEISSSKDEISIESVDNIKGALKFSNANINAVKEKISLTMDVSELRVSKITNTTPFVDINQESSEVHINITDLSFAFKATLEEGLLRLPKSFSNIESNVIDKSKRIREITGKYGKFSTGTFSFIGRKGAIVLDE